MRILVCFKAVPNWEKVLDTDWDNFTPETDLTYAGTSFNCFDESALELALRLKDAQGAVCTAITVGKAPSAALTEALFAAGFNEVVVIAESGAEFNPALVSTRLAAFAAAEGFDLILTGIEAGMADTGLVPHFLAARLNLPLFAGIQNIDEIAQTPAIASVGNTPAVLRAVNLRARMAARGRAPRLIPYLPAAESFTTPPVGGGVLGVPPPPVLTRPQTGRNCEFLDPDKLTETAKTLLNHLKKAQNLRKIESKQAILREKALKKHPEITIFDAENGDLAQFSRMVPDTNRNFFAASEIVEVGEKSVTVSKKCCASNLVWTATLSYPVALAMSAAPAKAGLTVICGMGVKTRENADAARLLAKRLNADFALTRPAALCGWGAPEEIVGQSGRRIAPETVLVLGASGAGAFLTGIEKAGKIIAVNSDPKALIWGHADVGVIADAPTLLGVLSDEIEGGKRR